MDEKRTKLLSAKSSVFAVRPVAVVVGILGVTGNVAVESNVRLVSLSIDSTRYVRWPILIREPVLVPRLGTLLWSSVRNFVPTPVIVALLEIVDTVPVSNLDVATNGTRSGTVFTGPLLESPIPVGSERSVTVKAAILSTTVIPLPITRPKTVCGTASRLVALLFVLINHSLAPRSCYCRAWPSTEFHEYSR